MMTPTQLMWTEIAAAVFLLLFACCLWGAVRVARQIADAKSWAKTAGEIIASQLKPPATHTSDDDEDVAVDIRYRYRVEGRDFEGHRVAIGDQFELDRVSAEHIVARYPLGARIDVHYNPRRPENAVLEPQTAGSIVGWLISTAVFGAIGGLLAAHAVAGKMIELSNGLPLFAFALPIAAMSVGVALVISSLRMRRDANASLTWPTTSGQIEESRVVEHVTEERDDNGNTRTDVGYRPDVRYAYQVEGRHFTSNNWKWGMDRLYGVPAGAHRVLAKYPRGQKVTVYYDPARPEHAVLEPKNRQGTLAPFVIGGMFGSVGIAMLILFVSVPWTRAAGY